MARSRSFGRTFRITRTVPDVARDVDDEIEHYLEMRTAELVEEGMNPEEARQAAEAAFGDRGSIEEECRQIDEPMVRRQQRFELWGGVWRDARRSARDLVRRPIFALAACLTLAICIGLNTAVFAVVHSILLAPLPYPDSERIVSVYNTYPNAGFPRASSTVPEYFDRKAAVTAFEDVALYQIRGRSVGEPGALRRHLAMLVTPSFFPVLGVEPMLGSGFVEDDTVPGNHHKVVLSYNLWQELFAGDQAAVGKTLRIEGVMNTVVGVMPESFDFPGWEARLWQPINMTERLKSQEGRLSSDYQMLARLRPGATITEAQSQLDAWNEILVEQVPPSFAQLLVDGGFGTRIVGFHADLVRYVEKWLYLLWGGSLFVLLIGGVSLTSLILVRTSGRLRELATRHVLGASRARLTVQLMAENLVLALIGGGLGLLGGFWSLKLVNVFSAFDIPRVQNVGLDPAVAALILLAAILVMTIASVVAVLTLQGRNFSIVLRGGASTARRGALRLRGGLVVAQIAIACVLLVGAALMSMSMWKLLSIDKGFDEDGVFVGTVSLMAPKYNERQARKNFYEEMLEDLASLPGVQGAALASQVPLGDRDSEETLLTPKDFVRQPGSELVSHSLNVVTPDYLSVAGIPLLTGRELDNRDQRGMPLVVLVSESVAIRYWQSVEAAIGKRVFVGTEALANEAKDDTAWRTVVGVVGEVVQRDLTDSARPGAVYIPFGQEMRRFTRVLLKTDGEAQALGPMVRDRVQALDPELVLFWVTTLEEGVKNSLLHFRIPMQLLLVFAATALLLAAIGVYGVLAQSVVQRTKEISIRLALGSSVQRIYNRVVGRALVLVAGGLTVGLVSAVTLSHLMTSLLYEVRPTDPEVLLAVALLVGVVALLAGAVPAWRATRINPVEALSSD